MEALWNTHKLSLFAIVAAVVVALSTLIIVPERQQAVITRGGEPVQVVCGAPNARTGMKGVFSPPGSYIPGKKITLGKGVIRGVESNGMLVSEAELELSDDHDGIIELPADAPVGQPYAVYAGLDDAVIEIAVTPNRADALGVAGIARDLAAAGLGKLKSSAVQPIAASTFAVHGTRWSMSSMPVP